MTDHQTELAKIEQAIATQKSLRGVLSDEQIETALVELHQKQAALIKQGDRGQTLVASHIEGDVLAAGANKSVVIARDGAKVFIGEQPVEITAVDRESALGQYLRHIISRNRYLQLQGIRSGGKLVHIELDQIYVTLRATRQRVVQAEEQWLAAEAAYAPGEMGRMARQMAAGRAETMVETVTVKVNEALADYQRLVVLGDPGSGKTTLLRYVALLYARDLAENSAQVQQQLALAESGFWPILLPLRQIGAFLKARPDEGLDGHALLLQFLFRSLKNERIELPADFFDQALKEGQAVILLDGLDEVADPELRRRVSQLVEAFTRAYPACRYVVTSRIVGYSGSARLGEAYATTTIRDFTLADVAQFLSHWHRLIAIGQMGPGSSAEAYAVEQTRQLLQAIRANERIRELAINPLLLTVIAMVHRDRVKLPDRRAELYDEAVSVLLGKWEEAKGVVDTPILGDKPFDTGDKRLMLQSVALKMQQKQLKEVEETDLRGWLGQIFHQILNEGRAAERAVSRFLKVIEERTGLLTVRATGVYAFSHLTFQEYLAALAVAEQDDYVAYTLQQVDKAWWREVILLEAGYLSTRSRERTTRLIEAIANLEEEPEPYHNLILAAECVRDVGDNRVHGNLEEKIRQQLRADIELDLGAEIERQRQEMKQQRPQHQAQSAQVETQPRWQAFWRRLLGTETARPQVKSAEPTPARFDEKATVKEITSRKVAAAQALARIGGESYWSQPYGEPEWLEIPAGEFWIGGEGKYDGKPMHQVDLPTFYIARMPITNAQYRFFVEATDYEAPAHWEDKRVPKGLESHPVVEVSWHDARAYCQWLSKVSGQNVSLPSEAEWEKAARGDKDKRVYPWGDNFEAARCNTSELGLHQTSPVGIFPNGASPYGCLDMSGNVWEWTRSIYQDYPYNPADGREDLTRTNVRVVLRGGAFRVDGDYARCAVRYYDFNPHFRYDGVGFRCVLLAAPSS